MIINLQIDKNSAMHTNALMKLEIFNENRIKHMKYIDK